MIHHHLFLSSTWKTRKRGRAIAMTGNWINLAHQILMTQVQFRVQWKRLKFVKAKSKQNKIP